MITDQDFVADDPGTGDTGLDFTVDRISFGAIPELAALPETGDVTVEAIVKPRSTEFQFIAANWPFGSGFQFALSIFDGEFGISFSDGVAGHSDIINFPIPCLNKWYSLAGVRDSVAGEVRFFVDGQLVGAAPLVYALSGQNDAFSIGARHNESLYLDGQIAEVRVSNAALGPESFLEAEFEECCCSDTVGPLGLPDDEIAFNDLLNLLANWGDCRGDCPTDCTGDGATTFADLLLLLSSWGPCGG